MLLATNVLLLNKKKIVLLVLCSISGFDVDSEVNYLPMKVFLCVTDLENP